jgi:hypothetical protein
MRSRFCDGAWFAVLALGAMVEGCSSASPALDASSAADSGAMDAFLADASQQHDAALNDAALNDAAPARDAGYADGNAQEDAISADSAPPADAGVTDASSTDIGMGGDAAGPWAEIGQGNTQFVPIAEGDKLVFNLGPQGGGRYNGYNVWGSLRANGVMPQGIGLSYSLTSTSGEVLASTNLNTNLMPDGSNLGIYGLVVIIGDCCKAFGRDLTYRVDVMDMSGVMRTDVRHVRGADQCPRDPRNPSVDPCG